MKTSQDFDRLISDEAAAIERLNHEFKTTEFESWERQARAYKAMRKEIGKRNDEIKRLRRLALFAESTPEEGIRMMVDKLSANISAATATAYRLFDPDGEGKNKRLIQEYLSNSQIPLKKKQIVELKFILS